MVSIVVVAYNSGDTLRECLESLVKLRKSEVIVVDNDSTDNSVSITQKFSAVQLIKSGANLGFNGGNQLGLDAAKGDIVVFLNPDTTVEADFDAKLETVFRNHADVGVVGCRILNKDGSLQRTCNRFPSLRSQLFEHSGYHKIFPHSKAYQDYIYDNWDRTTERYVDAVSGACTAVRTQLLRDIGGLDTRYFLFYEEPDLSKAVMRAGKKIFFTPSISISHVGSTSTQKSDQTFINRTYLESRDRYMVKHYGRWYLRWFLTSKFVFDKLAGVKRRLGATT
jgi:GT2 family glycosyltransferase